MKSVFWLIFFLATTSPSASSFAWACGVLISIGSLVVAVPRIFNFGYGCFHAAVRMDRFLRLTPDMELMAMQFKRNGGTTIIDKVDKIVSRVGKLEEGHQKLDAGQAEVLELNRSQCDWFANLGIAVHRIQESIAILPKNVEEIARIQETYVERSEHEKIWESQNRKFEELQSCQEQILEVLKGEKAASEKLQLGQDKGREEQAKGVNELLAAMGNGEEA